MSARSRNRYQPAVKIECDLCKRKAKYLVTYRLPIGDGADQIHKEKLCSVCRKKLNYSFSTDRVKIENLREPGVIT